MSGSRTGSVARLACGCALSTAILLAMIPYLLLRGPVNRLVRRRMRAAAR